MLGPSANQPAALRKQLSLRDYWRRINTSAPVATDQGLEKYTRARAKKLCTASSRMLLPQLVGGAEVHDVFPNT